MRKGLYQTALNAAQEMSEIFGEDHFYLELQDHGIPDQKTVNQGLLRLAKDTGLELVATNDIHYTLAEDAQAHDVLLCIQTGKKVADTDRMRYEGGQYYVKSPEEMASLFLMPVRLSRIRTKLPCDVMWISSSVITNCRNSLCRKGMIHGNICRNLSGTVFMKDTRRRMRSSRACQL